MGVTYKAIDTNLHCPVALKVINSRYLDDESVRERFLTEARAAAGLRHPNVASVFHLGTVDGDYFYAMEFVEGESSTGPPIRGPWKWSWRWRLLIRLPAHSAPAIGKDSFIGILSPRISWLPLRRQGR